MVSMNTALFLHDQIKSENISFQLLVVYVHNMIIITPIITVVMMQIHRRISDNINENIGNTLHQTLVTALRSI